MTRREKFFICFILSICVFSLNIHCEEHEDEDSETEPEESTIEVVYVTPKIPPNAYLFETFDEISNFENKWVKSRAKKDDVDENIAKYDGLWAVEQAEKDPLTNDFGLVLKSKAKHAAISVLLTKPYVFKDKPFVVQYEVNLQNGQECGGAYIKLLSKTDNGFKLEKFNDKTPYTLMFGPDKCGNDHKLHFIFRHVNPLTKEIEEKHCKKPKDKVEEPFKDKNPHLYTLILRPDNSFEVLLDHQVINSGHLLEDFTPPVNPAREIDDPNDIKPADWDEREKIADPSAVKPDDWDESAPRQIVDQFSMKPDDWLEDAPELLPDPEAVKPDDWDDEMDGEWEAPLVPNPKCEGISGCGPWKPPMIDNPDYKGKWKAPMIDNPNYKGKWTPRRIHNPDFFEDLEPFKMTTISAVGLELWSMSDNIYFDNILITDNIDEAQQVAAETFDLKLAKLNRGQTTLWGKIRKFTNDSPWMWLSYTLYCTVPISCIIVYLLKKVYEKGIISQAIDFSNKHPWIYGVYVLALAIPVVLVFLCCCAEDVKEDKEALRKKTDEPTADDPVKDEEEIRRSDNENVSEGKGDEEIEDEEEEEEEEEEAEAEAEAEEEEKAARMEEENEAKAESEENEDKEKSESDGEKSQEETRTSPRLRKVRKE